MEQALGKDLKEILENVRRFAQKELAPYAEELDEEERLAPGVFKRMGEIGLLGLTAPVEYGGAGQSPVVATAVMEELSHADPGTALSYLAHAFLFVHNLAQNGSPELCRKYLPAAIAGDLVGGLAMTEPNAGSDVLSMQTTAVRDGDSYVLNGNKMFITNAPVADAMIVYARVHDERKAISAFVVERGLKGFTAGAKLNKMGMRASPTGELEFRDCRVPATCLLGVDGDALKGMMRNLDFERVTLAGISLGIARACLDHAIKYTSRRQQFGQPVLNFQSVGDKVANMYIQYRAARALVFEAAQLVADGRRANQEAAAAKVFASEMATRVALDAIQVFGGYGYLRDFPVEKLLRDAKLLEIGGGTSEVLRGIVVKEFMRKLSSQAARGAQLQPCNQERSATAERKTT